MLDTNSPRMPVTTIHLLLTPTHTSHLLLELRRVTIIHLLLQTPDSHLLLVVLRVIPIRLLRPPIPTSHLLLLSTTTNNLPQIPTHHQH
jgi:hypothetical protein